MTDKLSKEAQLRLSKLKKRLKKIVDEAKKDIQGMTLEEALGTSEIFGRDPKAPTPRVLMTNPALEGLLEKTLADFEPKEKWVSWIPQELPNFRYYTMEVEDDLGISTKKYFTLMVDGVKMAFQVHTMVSAPAAFYHLYKNQEEASKEFRRLQRTGPEFGPHSIGGPSGSNSWMFIPEAYSAWMDIDGKWIKANESYLMYKGVPVPLGEFTTLRSGQLEGQTNNGDLIGLDYPTNEPEPEWHKTKPRRKRVTNVQENKSQPRTK